MFDLSIIFKWHGLAPSFISDSLSESVRGSGVKYFFVTLKPNLEFGFTIRFLALVCIGWWFWTGSVDTFDEGFCGFWVFWIFGGELICGSMGWESWIWILGVGWRGLGCCMLVWGVVWAVGLGPLSVGAVGSECEGEEEGDWDVEDDTWVCCGDAGNDEIDDDDGWGSNHRDGTDELCRGTWVTGGWELNFELESSSELIGVWDDDAIEKGKLVSWKVTCLEIYTLLVGVMKTQVCPLTRWIFEKNTRLWAIV